jgi:uncharacterized membrane protein (UPF0127 family)
VKKVRLLLVFPLLLVGCGEPATNDLHTTEITTPGGKTILAETMLNDFDLQRGMMFRDALPKDRGMLFVHPKESNYPHWTYNVRIPLDILWLDHDRRIVEIYPKAPPCTAQSSRTCPNYGGDQKSRYELELNGGRAAELGLQVGDTLSF